MCCLSIRSCVQQLSSSCEIQYAARQDLQPNNSREKTSSKGVYHRLSHLCVIDTETKTLKQQFIKVPSETLKLRIIKWPFSPILLGERGKHHYFITSQIGPHEIQSRILQRFLDPQTRWNLSLKTCL